MPRINRRRGKRIPPSAATSVIPTIALSSSSVSLPAVAGATTPVQTTVTATSGNGGALGGIGIGTITMASGSGWLTATVQGTYPALITISCNPLLLTAGTYTGTVALTDSKASNSPQSISVSFVVSAAVVVPTIALSSTTMALSVQEGNPATATGSILISSGNAGGLTGPTVGTISGTGLTGVTGSISGSGTYTLTVTATSAALTSAGSPYTATVPILDAGASNSPQNLTVTLTVTAVSPPPTPTISLSSAALSMTAVAGSGVTRTADIVVSSGNGATLGTTSVGTVTGTASTAVTTSVSGHTVTINAAVGSFSAGSYSATIPILDTLASNSPQNVTLTWTVTSSVVPATTIPAAIVPFGSPTGGTVLVAGGWPLPKGSMTAADVTAKKFAIFINGVEQRCSVVAHPGLHPDGTIRSVEYQFNIPIPTTTPIVASVVLGTPRTTTDLARQTLTPNLLWVEQPAQTWGVDAEPTAKLVATDTAYLCATDVTLEPLQPATQDDPASYARLVTFPTQRLAVMAGLTDTSRDLNGVRSYQATYESSRALIAMWCRTGVTDYLREALRQGYRLLEYDTPTTLASRPVPTSNVFGEARMVSVNGQPGEPQSLRYINYASCWMLSSYVPFFAGVNSRHQDNNSALRTTASGANAVTTASTGGYIDATYLIRFNLARSYPHVIAYAIGANRRQQTPSGFGNRNMNFATELPLIIGALINSTYAKGDYRDGLTGLSSNSTNGIANGGTGAGAVPNFQINYINHFLMLYEREVLADSRIPAMIKANTDVILANTSVLTAGGRGFGYTDSGYGTSYWANPTAATTGGQSDYLGYSSGSLAYCAAKYPTAVVNGATYAQWYARAVDFKNVGATGATLGSDWIQYARAWKIFGEAFGFQQAGPYMMTQGVPAGPASIQTLTVPVAWPG